MIEVRNQELLIGGTVEDLSLKNLNTGLYQNLEDVNEYEGEASHLLQVRYKFSLGSVGFLILELYY